MVFVCRVWEKAPTWSVCHSSSPSPNTGVAKSADTVDTELCKLEITLLSLLFLYLTTLKSLQLTSNKPKAAEKDNILWTSNKDAILPEAELMFLGKPHISSGTEGKYSADKKYKRNHRSCPLRLFLPRIMHYPTQTCAAFPVNACTNSRY